MKKGFILPDGFLVVWITVTICLLTYTLLNLSMHQYIIQQEKEAEIDTIYAEGIDHCPVCVIEETPDPDSSSSDS